MKTSALIPFLFLAGATCFADYTPQYDSYWTFAFNPETSTETLSVVLDGTTTGDCWLNGGTYYIPNCPANHLPQVTNVINSTNASADGPSVDMFDYISFEVDNPTALATGTDYFSFSLQASVLCFVAAANIFDTGYLTGSGGSPSDIPLNQYAGQCYTNYNSSGRTVAQAYWKNDLHSGCFWSAPENESYPTWTCAPDGNPIIPTCLQTSTNKRCAWQQIFMDSACVNPTSSLWHNIPR